MKETEVVKVIAVGEPTAENIAAAFEHLSPAQRIVVENDLRFVAFRALYRRPLPKCYPFLLGLPMFFDLASDGGVVVRIGARHRIDAVVDDFDLILAASPFLSFSESLLHTEGDENQNPTDPMGRFAAVVAFDSFYRGDGFARTMFRNMVSSQFVGGAMTKGDESVAFLQRPVPQRYAHWKAALFEGGSEESQFVARSAMDLFKKVDLFHDEFYAVRRESVLAPCRQMIDLFTNNLVSMREMNPDARLPDVVLYHALSQLDSMFRLALNGYGVEVFSMIAGEAADLLEAGFGDDGSLRSACANPPRALFVDRIQKLRKIAATKSADGVEF
jgi:hypothetical protein